MEELRITIDPKGIDEAIQKLQHIKNGAKTAIYRALKKAGEGIKTDSGVEAPRIFHIDATTVKKRMKIRYGAGKTSVTVERSGRPLSATRFPHDPNENPGRRGGRAVFVRPRKDGGGELLNARGNLSKAFVVAGIGVFRRTSPSRKPIDFARVISVPEMLNDPAINPVIQDGAVKRFHKELNHQVSHLLSSSGGGL